MMYYTFPLLIANLFLAGGESVTRDGLRKGISDNETMDMGEDENAVMRDANDVGAVGERASEKQLSWQPAGGANLFDISVDYRGNNIWGTDYDDKVWYRAGRNGTWREMGGNCAQISVSGDNNHLWCVDDKEQIYFRHGKHGRWERKDGSFTHVSVNHNGDAVWAVNSRGEVWFREGRYGSWSKISTNFIAKRLDVSGDGTLIIAVDSDYKNMYYRRGVPGNWISMDGSLYQISIDDEGGNIWGTSRNHEINYRNGIKKNWVVESDKREWVAVSGDGKWVWSVDTNDEVSYRSGYSNDEWKHLSVNETATIG
eukprot:CAMPEP_0172512362 /NCGR_PEP_ID=MMETSP1066-20121228/244009_1 /TAXON_ID=671091 /ORGANISM="Coscinodiscus wailesii, Strain CCMP2513" /LENGTH=311 /DNA_ID=CAMNT_0013292145 /DNA_START=53 /DNA_END=988 /DNA_ORIENTATION=-